MTKNIKLTWNHGDVVPDKYYIYRDDEEPISKSSLPSPYVELVGSDTQYIDASNIEEDEEYHYFLSAELNGALYPIDEGITVSSVNDGIDSIDIENLTSEGTYSLPVSSAYDIVFYDGGSRFVVANYSQNQVNEFVLDTPYDVSSHTQVNSFTASNATTVGFSDDGLIFNWVRYSSPITTWYLSVPFDLSSVIDTKTTSNSRLSGGVCFADSGKYFITTDRNSNIYVNETQSPFDPQGATLIDTINLGVGNLYGLKVSDDGMKLYVARRSSTVHQFDMTSPFDFNSLTLTTSKSIGISAYGITVHDGKMFVVDDTGNRVETFS